MNKLLLRIVQWFNPVWRGLGVDTLQLAAILETRLLMDGRRTTVFSQGRASQKSELKNQDWLSMGVFFMMGLFMMTILLAFESSATALAVYFMVWMFMLAMTLISDFTDVLIDVRDNYILLPRPVSDRTIAVSRLLHIGLYLSKLTFAFALPGFIYMCIAKFPWGGPVFMLQLLLSVLISIFAVNLIYLALLRFTTPRKFKEIISYFQIGFSVFILGSYYLLPRIVDFKSLQDIEVYDIDIMLFLPSTWIASIWSILGEGDFRALVLIQGLLSVVVPMVALFLITEVLAKHFNAKMMAINEGGANLKEAEEKPWLEQSKKGWMYTLSRRFCSTPAESAGFEITWLITKRSRDFKLKSYPSFAFVIVLFLYYMLQGEGSLQQRLSQASHERWYILLIYMVWITFSALLSNVRFSNKYKASWIYLTVPIKTPGPILLGTFKAIFIRFYLPYLIVIMFAAMPVWGWGILDDFIFGMLGTMSLTLITALLAGKHRLPFSDSWANQSKGNNFVASLTTLILTGIVGGGHYFLTNYGWIIGVLCIPMAFLLLLLMRSYRKIGWSKIWWAGE